MVNLLNRASEGVQEGIDRLHKGIVIVRHAVSLAAQHVRTGKFPDVRDPDQRSCVRCTSPLHPKMVEAAIQEEVWRNACNACGWIDWDAPIPVVAGLLPFPKKLIGATNVNGPFDFTTDEYADPSETGIVVIKRGNEPFRGQWALPGGYMMRGDTPARSLGNEMLQEVGVRVRLEKFLHPCNPVPGRLNQVILHGLVSPVDGSLEAGDDAEEVAIVGSHNMPDLCFSSHQKTVRDYLNGRNGRIKLRQQYP